MNNITPSHFTNETEADLRRAHSNGGLDSLGGTTKNKQIGRGDIVICENFNKKHIFGVVIVSGACIEPSLIDARNNYTESKYNKFEIPVSHLFLFPRPLSYEEFKDILHIPIGVKTNLTHFQHLKHMPASFKVYGVEAAVNAEIMRRLAVWVATYV